MKPAPFAYVRPASVDELCEQLARHGEDARILAGGQSLGAMLNMRLVTPRVLIDINRIAGFGEVDGHRNGVTTGAMLRQAQAMRDPLLSVRVPLLAAALPYVGHYQTRSRGTLAGSVAHADPSAEVPLVLFALNGEVELRSLRRTRRIAAREFFKAALTTARAADEAVTALHWPLAPAGSRHAFRELAMRAGDYAVVAGACQASVDNDGRLSSIALAFGACADRPQLIDASAFIGQQLDANAILEMADAAGNQVECKGDLHASAAYRRQLVRLFARDMLHQIAGTAARAGEARTPSEHQGEPHDPA